MSFIPSCAFSVWLFSVLSFQLPLFCGSRVYTICFVMTPTSLRLSSLRFPCSLLL